MNTELEHLKKMRELLARGWTQHALARDYMGRPVMEDSPEATRFCLMGASLRALSPRHWPLPAVIVRLLGDCRADEWNDMPERTQAEVLALIDRAIEIAEAAQ